MEKQCSKKSVYELLRCMIKVFSPLRLNKFQKGLNFCLLRQKSAFFSKAALFSDFIVHFVMSGEVRLKKW